MLCAVIEINVVAIFVIIAMVKVKLIPDFYTLAIVLINQREEIGKKKLIFCIIEGPK